jgi:hypothetical protein
MEEPFKLSKEDIEALNRTSEGKFIQWVDGVKRHFRIIAQREEPNRWDASKKNRVFTLLDMDNGEEKELTSNFKFIRELAHLGIDIDQNTVLAITPIRETYMKDGEEKTSWGFSIELADAGAVKAKETAAPASPF